MRYPDIDTVRRLLPVDHGNYELLVKRQNVYDIVHHSLAEHKLSAPMYDRFADLFWQGNVPDTCLSIFAFCKKYIPYDAEDRDVQTVKPPNQILSDGKLGDIEQDCKHYGLFCCGIVDSLHRMGYPISCKFRFASDVAGEKYPKHVFCIVYDGADNNPIWLDPVLNYVNQYHKYYYFLDKKCPNMALYRVSGVNDDSNALCGFGAGLSNAYVGKHKGLHIKIKAPKILKKVENTVKKDLKKVKLPHIKIQPGKLLMKVGMAPSRNAFLLLVKINAFDIAYNFFKHAQTTTGRDKIKKLWEKVGGKWKNLQKDINQGFRVYLKHHGKKMDAGWHTISGYDMGGYMGIVGADDAAEGGALAAAMPVIKVFLDLFKQLGISTQKIQTKEGASVKTLSINHNNSDKGSHEDGTETTLQLGHDGKQHLTVHSFQGNKEESDDSSADDGDSDNMPMPASYKDSGASDDDDNADVPSKGVRKDVANKMAEKDADDEVPDAKSDTGKAVNVFSDWARGVKTFVEDNKGTVITIGALTATVLAIKYISSSPTKKRRR